MSPRPAARRRPPSDERALKGYTDPGIVKAVCTIALLAVVLIAGLALVVRGLL